MGFQEMRDAIPFSMRTTARFHQSHFKNGLVVDKLRGVGSSFTLADHQPGQLTLLIEGFSDNGGFIDMKTHETTVTWVIFPGEICQNMFDN